MRETGTVKWFSVEKGYGFIERDAGGDIFAHRTDIEAGGVKKLEAGERVEFDVESSPKGPKASRIAAVGAAAHAGPAGRREPASGRRAAEDASATRRRGGGEAAGEPGVPGETLSEQLRRKLGGRLLRRG